jgi:transcriptional regulator with XRE-family HTH domain
LFYWQSSGTYRKTGMSSPRLVQRGRSEKPFGKRKQHDISQEQLALESGLDRTYVSLIERGVQSPTIRSIVKLADVLGVKPSEIVLRMEALAAKARNTRSK